MPFLALLLDTCRRQGNGTALVPVTQFESRWYKVSAKHFLFFYQSHLPIFRSLLNRPEYYPILLISKLR